MTAERVDWRVRMRDDHGVFDVVVIAASKEEAARQAKRLAPASRIVKQPKREQ